MSEKAVNYIQGYDDGYEDATRKYSPKECVRKIIINAYQMNDEFPDMVSICSACGAKFNVERFSQSQINYCPNCGCHFHNWTLE